MDDDERAGIARRALKLVNQAERLSRPATLQAEAQKAVEDAARDALLGAVGKVVGRDAPAPPPPPVRSGPTNEELDQTLSEMQADSSREFDRQLAAVSLQAEKNEAMEQAELAILRKSFPAESRELAALVFGAMDLMHDVVERDHPPTEEHLRKREELLSRIEVLLRPKAGIALESFVAHVVSLSRRRRRA